MILTDLIRVSCYEKIVPSNRKGLFGSSIPSQQIDQVLTFTDLSRIYLSATLYITFLNVQKSNQKTHRLRILKRLRAAVEIISMVLSIKCLLPILSRYEILNHYRFATTTILMPVMLKKQSPPNPKWTGGLKAKIFEYED